MPNYQRIKGFADLFFPESNQYVFLEKIARDIFSKYGFLELKTPIMEYTELFTRSIGESTDVVSKEMFTFNDSKGRSMSLRPEATAGVMRAVIEAGLARNDTISRLFTTGPMFRHERPQKGRMRQFHQINCEYLGTQSPLADAELISMLMQFLNTIGIKNYVLKLNSLGCHNCRPKFNVMLQEFFNSCNKDEFCDVCQRRMITNPLRVLDCKESVCKNLISNAPHLLDVICDDCKNHFKVVTDLLNKQNIKYEIDHCLVRGLDYYTRTTFEVQSVEIGAQSAIAGGGRYDGLIKQLGGADVAGVGFACGMERLVLLMKDCDLKKPDFYLLVMKDDDQINAQMDGFSLVQKLREQGFIGNMNMEVGSFKSLMRQADKSNAKYCLVLGIEERQNVQITIKDMENGIQKTIKQSEIFDILKTGLNNE